MSHLQRPEIGSLGRLLTDPEAAPGEWYAGLTDEPAHLRGRQLTDEISLLRREVAASISDVVINLEGHIGQMETRLNQELMTQTRWMLAMWVGQIAATAAIVAALFRVFSD